MLTGEVVLLYCAAVVRQALLVSLSLLLLPEVASATAFQVEARTEAQVYSMRSYSGTDPSTPTLLPRRRLVQYLGLNAYELISKEPIGFESSLRVYADFGLSQSEAQMIDGMRSQDADLLFANLIYRGDRFTVRIGRQTYTDLMDITAFDGGYVRYLHPFQSGFKIGAEAYAGLWVKAGAVLSSSVYQPDGIRESDLRRVAAMTAPAYSALDDIEPLVGAKLLLENLYGISASAGYRQSWLSGKTDIQRLAIEAKYGTGRGFNLLGGVEYDLFTARISNARALARLDFSELSGSLEYMRVSPVLSADSIFLYFASAPRDGFRARVDYHPVGLFRYYVQGVGDLYSTPINSTIATAALLTDPNLPGNISAGGSAGAAMRAGPVHLSLDGTYKTGWGGRQAWVDLAGGWASEGQRVTADARITYANIFDNQNTQLRGNFIGGQLWGSYLLTNAARLSLVLEQNFGGPTRSDTKLFFLLDLKAVL